MNFLLPITTVLQLGLLTSFLINLLSLFLVLKPLLLTAVPAEIWQVNSAI